MSHTGVTGTGEHMTPVLPAGIDPSFSYLQEQTSLDAIKDAVGVVDLVQKRLCLERLVTA